MHLTFISNVSLPIRTGPALTAAERANYFIKNHNVTLWYPYLNPYFQSKVWGTKMTKNKYLVYLRNELGINENISVKLYDSEYDGILQWQYPRSNLDVFEMMRGEQIIFEDCISFLFHTPYIFLLRKYAFLIAHTDYINIIPKFFRFYALNYYKSIFNFVHPLIIIAYNSQIGGSIISPKHVVSVLPIHGVRDTFNISSLPDSHSVYFMGKLDNDHKRFTELCEFTTGICELHAYGEGKDKKLLSSYSHIIYHGSVQDVPNEIKQHKILVHASECEGITTVIAEAIHMNKFVLVKHAKCHDIFKHISNVYFYKNQKEFAHILRALLSAEPRRIPEKDKFTWEKANRIFENVLT